MRWRPRTLRRTPDATTQERTVRHGTSIVLIVLFAMIVLAAVVQLTRAAAL